MKKLLVFIAVLFWAAPALAAKLNNADVITFNPATDGGKYITVHQSATLPQWHFNFGTYLDYARQPLEYADPLGNRRRGIVDDFLIGNFLGAFGWTDWLETGINMPVVFWNTYYNPATPLATVIKDNRYFKLGDLRVEAKARILDIERYHIGLAFVPFVMLPTGDSGSVGNLHYMGNGMWKNFGGKLVFDVDIKNRVFMAVNTGYHAYERTNYDGNTPNAVINDTIELGGGLNVRITDSWAALAEIYSEHVLTGIFKNQLQNPMEFLAGARFTPQKGLIKGLGVTVAGGRGMTTGIGSPDIRAIVGINYRKPKVVKLPPPVEVEVVAEEKIVITQKVHFEFNKAIIRPVSYPILDDVAYLLKINPQIKKVRVEGHTDWIGGDAYNQRLSEKRAGSVRDYLVEKGIAPERLEAVGYGEARPIADNNTTQGRARNRRTEFTVLE